MNSQYNGINTAMAREFVGFLWETPRLNTSLYTKGLMRILVRGLWRSDWQSRSIYRVPINSRLDWLVSAHSGPWQLCTKPKSCVTVLRDQAREKINSDFGLTLPIASL